MLRASGRSSTTPWKAPAPQPLFLANIDIQPSPFARYRNGKPAFLPRRRDYIRRLPDFLLESPLVDRSHGIIPGWKIPPLDTTKQAQGYGLKADYFAEV